MRIVGVAVWVALLVAPVAAATSWSEFRADGAVVDSARLAFSYRYYDDASTPFVDANSGRLAASYGLLSDAPHLGVAIDAAADFALTGFVPTAWLGRSAAAARLYPWEDGLPFLFAGLEAGAATGLPQAGLEARAGLGLGRMRDVTPLAKAVRVSSALEMSGVLPGGLPEDILVAVAALLGRADQTASMDELLTEIEAIVVFAAGVPLDVRSLLAIEDIASSSASERVRGLVFAAGIGFELLDPYGGEQDVVGSVSADAAALSGPEDQLLFHASASAPFADLAENTLIATGSYELEFGMGQTLAAGYTLLRVQPSGASAEVTHQASLALTFRIGRGHLGLQVAAARRSGDPGWSLDVSMTASLDLL